jgi:hypothetical protein
MTWEEYVSYKNFEHAFELTGCEIKSRELIQLIAQVKAIGKTPDKTTEVLLNKPNFKKTVL